MPEQGETGRRVIKAWRTNHKATTYLVEHLPPAIWPLGVPASAAHRRDDCRTSTTAGACGSSRSARNHGITAPPLVEAAAGDASGPGARAGAKQRRHHRADRAGHRQRRLVRRARWQNFPTDLEHFLSYFVAHEAYIEDN